MRIPPRPNLPARNSVGGTGVVPPPRRVAPRLAPEREPEIDDEMIVPMKTDICIYGATSAGMVAAAVVVNAGLPVLLIEPGRHLGGLSSGGISHARLPDPFRLPPQARDFYQRIGRVYKKEMAQEYEPCVAEAVCNDLSRDFNLTVLYCHRLAELKKSDDRISQILLDRAMTDEFNAPLPPESDEERTAIEAKVFIDCSYEGDLMAAAGVRSETGEARLNFNLCLSSNLSNRLEIRPPQSPGKVEALVAEVKTNPFQFVMLPNGKVHASLEESWSWRLLGSAESYLTADLAKRGSIWRDGLVGVADFLSMLRTDGKVPRAVQQELLRWSLCTDEFQDTQGWPHQAQIIDGRRLVPGRTSFPDPIGLTAVEGRPIRHDSILPDAADCQNLLVPVCSALNESDEPTRMAVAEAAACLAIKSLKRRCGMQAVTYIDLRESLDERGIELE